jgi:HSP20 family protein
MVRDIFDELREIERRMDRLFRSMWAERPALMGGTAPASRPGELAAREPFTDIIETDKEVILTAEIPGVRKEDIRINATEDSIEISAETKREEEEEKEDYYRRERSYSSFYRSYTLPSKVNPDGAKASCNNGVLEVRLPKTEEKKGREVKID